MGAGSDGDRLRWIEQPIARLTRRLERRHLAGRMLVAALAMPLLAFVLVVVADAVPDRWVLDNLHEATVSEGLDTNSYDRGYAGGLTDGFSECKRLTIGLGDLPGVHPVESALLSPTLGGCDVAVPKIIGWAEGDGLVRSYDYPRYWNGSAAVFRPLVATVGVAGTRVLAVICIAAITTLYAAVLRRRFGTPVAAVVLFPLLLTTDIIDLPGALLHALAWVVALAAASVLLLLPSETSDGAVAWWSFVAGGVFVFFADMANPELAWSLAVASIALTAADRLPALRALRRTAAAAAAWFAGFAWLWFTKWPIAASVVGFERMWDDVTGQIDERLGGEVDGVSPSALDALDRVLTAWWDVPLTPIVIPALVAAVIAVVVRSSGGQPGGVSVGSRLVVLLPATIPLLWYVMLRNHTYVHFWFVYRSLAVVAAIAGAAVLIGRSGGRAVPT